MSTGIFVVVVFCSFVCSLVCLFSIHKILCEQFLYVYFGCKLFLSCGSRDEDQSAENAGLSNVLSWKPGESQNMALHVLPTASKCTFLLSVFRVCSVSFLPDHILRESRAKYPVDLVLIR